MDDEAPPRAASTPMGPRAIGLRGVLAGVAERRMAFVAMVIARSGARPSSRNSARPMPRSISAPIIAGSWSRGRPPTGFRVVDAFSRIIRLGEGVAASRRISEAAIARAVEALAVCRDKMRARGVMRARLIATEACRAAENGEEFRSRVAREAGLELEIIDSATEARLAATGCTELFDPAAIERHPVRYRRRLVGIGAA